MGKSINKVMAMTVAFSTLTAQYDELDLCRTGIYMLDNAKLSEKVSKVMVKTLEEVLEDEVKRLKVKERFL
jgi:hypothetical protein